VASDGGVFSFGNAQFWGSTGSLTLNKPIVGMAADPATGGYWLVASDGGVFSFNAPFHGSTGNLRLNKPIVGMDASPGGSGYWLAASDGGVFTFGSSQFFGSMGAVRLNQPVVGMAADAATGGYWLVAGDGGIFSFNAPFLGSTGNIQLAKPVVGMETNTSGSGYRFVASDGGIFTFGSSQFFGSAVSPLPIGICTVTMSNPNPKGDTGETATLRTTVPNAAVILTVNYKNRVSTANGATDGAGNGDVDFEIEHPVIGYPVSVIADVGNGTAFCSTSFTPR
jgi:hypothetical protein